ncbi:hypothetical protein Tco_0464357 [Tanacetum coccineum]
MLNDDDNGKRDYLEFISQVNSKFKNYGRENDGTKKALFRSWINGSWHKELIDDIVSSDEEWEESDFGNHPKTNTDSFFKPYLETHEKMTLEERMNYAERSELAERCDMISEDDFQRLRRAGRSSKALNHKGNTV